MPTPPPVSREKKIELTPEVRQMYLWVEQELNLIKKAIEPLDSHIKYMRQIGEFDPLKDSISSTL